LITNHVVRPTWLKNIMEEIVGLAEAGRGNALPSVSGTLWTAYNGVAEWPMSTPYSSRSGIA
jgi:hypothetical protein